MIHLTVCKRNERGGSYVSVNIEDDGGHDKKLGKISEKKKKDSINAR
jgi:hypothetical protein